MPEFEANVNVTVDFEAWCSECRNGICNNFQNDRYGTNRFDVEPCEKCLKNKYDEGYKDGRSEMEDEMQEEIDSLKKKIESLEAEEG